MINAHINVEVSAGIQNVKYLFKYVYKIPDHVATVIAGPTNKIQQYIDDIWMLLKGSIPYFRSKKYGMAACHLIGYSFARIAQRHF